MNTWVPRSEHRVGTDVLCRPVAIQDSVVQDHLLRHVFGTQYILGQTLGAEIRRWNAEGWDEDVPPFLTAEVRAKLAEAIKELQGNGERCAIPRLDKMEYRGPSFRKEDPQYCMRCPTELLDACAALCRDVRVGYLSVVDRHMAALKASPRIVDEMKLMTAVTRLVRDPDAQKLGAALILRFGYAGRDNGRRIGRLATGGGVVIEFTANWDANGSKFSLDKWRTTYRDVRNSPAQQASLLLRAPRSRGDAFGRCWVSDDWWQMVGED